jgi:hypothetical protein
MTFDDSRLRRNAAIFIATGLIVAVREVPATAAMPGHGASHKRHVTTRQRLSGS